MSIKLGILAIGASMVMASTALATTATTIINDTFPSSQGQGTGAYVVNSAASPTDVPGTKWNTSYEGSTMTDANQPFISGNSMIFPDASAGNVSAAIGFTPSNNGVLTLTATLTYAGGEWIGMGFGNSASSAGPGNSGPWVLMDQQGSSLQLFGQSGSSNYVPSTTNSSGAKVAIPLGSNTNTLTLTYNPVSMVETVSVSDSSSADYITASLPLSDFTVGGKAITTPPTINSIWFGTRAGNPNGSSVSDVTLTEGPAQVVPEPATVGLFGMGAAAGLLLLGRRRKTA